MTLPVIANQNVDGGSIDCTGTDRVLVVVVFGSDNRDAAKLKAYLDGVEMAHLLTPFGSPIRASSGPTGESASTCSLAVFYDPAPSAGVHLVTADDADGDGAVAHVLSVAYSGAGGVSGGFGFGSYSGTVPYALLNPNPTPPPTNLDPTFGDIDLPDVLAFNPLHWNSGAEHLGYLTAYSPTMTFATDSGSIIYGWNEHQDLVGRNIAPPTPVMADFEAYSGLAEIIGGSPWLIQFTNQGDNSHPPYSYMVAYKGAPAGTADHASFDPPRLITGFPDGPSEGDVIDGQAVDAGWVVSPVGVIIPPPPVVVRGVHRPFATMVGF